MVRLGVSISRPGRLFFPNPGNARASMSWYRGGSRARLSGCIPALHWVRFAPGQLVELAAVLGDGRHTYTLTAQTAGSVLLLPIQALSQAFQEHPPLRMQLLEELAREVSRAYYFCCTTHSTKSVAERPRRRWCARQADRLIVISILCRACCARDGSLRKIAAFLGWSGTYTPT